MMNYVDKSFLSSNGRTTVRLRCYTPNGSVRGTIQIAHGIAEHLERYHSFCSWLTDNGWAVFINDHVGHGKSIIDSSEKGFFDSHNGWMIPVQDMHSIYSMSADSYPSLPHVLFGHSMGSFLSRTYLFTYPDDFHAAVLCGTAQMQKGMLAAGKAVAELLAVFAPRGRSKLLNALAFGSYNKCFQPARTEYDWLSRDTGVVDRYILDPDCGFICTTRLYADMLGGLQQIESPRNAEKMNKALPVLFIAGTMDPVGENGAGVKRAAEMFRSVGMEDVSLRLYDNCRHELLNELNHQEVFRDVLSWINTKTHQEEIL